MPEPSLVTGWGRSTRSAAATVTGVGRSDVRRVLDGAPPRGVLARGLGRAYNDAAQNAGGTVVEAAVMHLDLDPSTGVVDVGGGVSLDTLMRRLVPRGWFVPVTPGTRMVTVGGAIAADVHGKNHHVDGSFADHVESLELLCPDGSIRTLAPDGPPGDSELFWATTGGLGLTGIVLSCRLRCLPVTSSVMSVETIRTGDLAETMRALVDADHRVRYSVAWVDLLAGGDALGRGVVSLADHADGRSEDGEGLTFEPRQRISVPTTHDLPVLNRLSIRAFNELWYRKAPRHRTGEEQPIATFFHPLDAVGRWNRLYGRRGFVQYQMVVPDASSEAVHDTIRRLVRRRTPSFLAVLKRFGAANPGPLSFPIPGWTLALDLPASVPGLAGLLDEIDRLVVDAGGRVYLAKDARLDPRLVEAMYPRIDEWRDTVGRLGHQERIDSDLDRRLGLRRCSR